MVSSGDLWGQFCRLTISRRTDPEWWAAARYSSPLTFLHDYVNWNGELMHKLFIGVPIPKHTTMLAEYATNMAKPPSSQWCGGPGIPLVNGHRLWPMTYITLLTSSVLVTWLLWAQPVGYLLLAYKVQPNKGAHVKGVTSMKPTKK
jgi:hypothetical protein